VNSDAQYVPSREEQEAFLNGTMLQKKLNLKQTHQAMDEFFRVVMRLHQAKQEDYASKDDGLSNFRQIAERLGLSLKQVFLTLIQKHVIALENEARSTRPLNEGVGDRLRDLACYAGLLHVALSEELLLSRKASWGL